MRWVESVGRTIRRHRKSKAATLAHLERAVRISVETLSAVEHDETRLSPTELSRLCVFLELDTRRLRAIETLATKLLERHVVAADDAPAANEPFAVDRVPRFPRSFEEINAVAAHWRRILPVPPHGRIAAPDFFERLDEVAVAVDGLSFRVDYAVRKLAHAVEARTRADMKARVIEVALSPEACRWMNQNPRVLFTICHELGHVVMHGAELTSADAVPAPPRIPTSAGTEWQAHTFAAAFIAPLEQVLALHDQIGSLSPVDLQRAFGLSKAAADYRLGAIDEHMPGRIRRFDPYLPLPFSRSAARE